MNDFNSSIATVVTSDIVLCWFRRDLRLQDNAALYHAIRENQNVLPLFIFDTVILNALDDTRDPRVEFIYETIVLLKAQLEKLNSSLLVLRGNPIDIFKKLKPKSVYTNGDYEPYATQRDNEVAKILSNHGIPFCIYKDQVIFEKDEVLKSDGKPYTIFTPYRKSWKAKLTSFYLKSYPTEKYFKNFKGLTPLSIPALKDLGFETTDAVFPERVIKTSVIEKYHQHRDFPAIQGTTRLSVHLRFGTVSIRKLASIATKKNEVWLNELIWRDFYHMILWYFPHVEKRAFKPAYDRIEWKNDPEEFKIWCEGQTGYPIVDAGMRELNSTGFMHNRVRMVVASFLTKHLLIDWRWGEAYFAKKLLDYDLAANNGGWQWAAGSGCDAAPYFRVFSPELQTLKFDNQNEYIKRWVPEFRTENYPKPMVDHKIARGRAIKTYKNALT